MDPVIQLAAVALWIVVLIFVCMLGMAWATNRWPFGDRRD